jgi:alpha-tubulin suppressor-like RCC1 family protein
VIQRKIAQRCVRVLLGLSLIGVSACSGESTSESRQRNAALPVANKRVGESVVAISANNYFNLAITNDGELYAWGHDFDGQATVPATLDGVKVTAVSAGGYHSLALDENGRVHAWGFDSFGAVPSSLDGVKVTAVSAGWYHSLALDENGRVHAWGYDTYGQAAVPSSLDGVKVTAVSAGWYHSLALDENGRVYAWGYNGFRQAAVPSSLDGVKATAVTAGGYHSLALDENGRVYGWGNDAYGQAAVPSSLDGVRIAAVSPGGFHSLALDENGRLHAWGLNNFGEATVPPSLNFDTARTMPIALGGASGFGVDEKGDLVSFSGKSGVSGGSYVSVAAGPRHVLAVTASGTVEAFGDYFAGQTAVPFDLNGVVQVVAGYSYSAALRHDGRVVEWGSHTAPSGEFISKPSDLPRLKHLAGGFSHILGITLTGDVVAWGSNQFEKATPPDGLDNVIDVAANYTCSAALRDNGDVVYWGGCSDQMKEKTSLPGATRIAMSEFSVAAIVDGSLIVWGDDWHQTLTAPEGDDFVALVGGTAAFLAVTTDGNVVAWGENNGEPLVIPVEFGGAPPVLNDEICEECEEPEQFQFTDEILKTQAGFLLGLLTPDQQKTFIEALGGSTTKPLSPSEIQALVDAATEAERAKARGAVNALTAPVVSVAALPASQNPGLKVGDVVSVKRATQILGLKKVTKVSFVVPKKSVRSCSVAVSKVTAKSSGVCEVKVRYVDAKKKQRTSTLSLLVG